MKQIFSAILAALFVISSVVLPPQPAQAMSLGSIASTIKVAGQDLRILVSENGGSMSSGLAIQLVDNSGKLVKTIVMKSGAADVLEAMKPSNLAKQLGELGKQSRNAGAKALSFAGHELLQFPLQSFGFFLAIGATVAEQAIFNDADDPVAFEHFFNSQVDPVGQFAFYTFMLANSGASQPLLSMIQNGKLNPRLAPFIPYLGMSLGMIASNITSEAGHSKGFKACAAEVITGKNHGETNAQPQSADQAAAAANETGKTSACDQAYQEWTKSGGFSETMMQWAPGIVSLLATTIVTTAIQSGAMKLATKIVTMSAIEVATFLVPGGFVVKALRAVGFVAQMALFTRINNVIDPFFTKLWENWRQGDQISDLESSLVKDLSGLDSAGWTSTALNADLAKLSQAMKAWRGMNAMDISASQSSWIENLNNFAGLYNAANGFYSAVVDELAKKKKYPSYDVHLLRPFPMNGIRPNNFKGDLSYLFTQPDDIAEMQLETVKAVSARLDQMYASNQAFLSSLGSGDRTTLLSILAALRSQDPNKIGAAMENLNFQIGYITQNNFGFDTTLSKALKNIKNLLGSPRPIPEKSAGFAIYYLLTPEMNQSADLDHQVKFWLNFFTYTRAETMADWLMASTLWGPDVSKHEKVIESTNGFYSQFLAPRLPLTSDSEYVCNSDPLAPTSRLSVCDNGVKYDNPLQFAVTHIQPQMIENNNFATWWRNNAETPYVQTWVDFENKYQAIVSKLVQRLWSTDRTITNKSDVANGLFAAAIQEINVNSLTLGGVIRVHLEQSGRQSDLNQLLARPNRLLPPTRTGLLGTVLNGNLDLSAVLQTQGYAYTEVPTAPGTAANFTWQNQLLTKLYEYQLLLRQIKVQPARLSTGDTINVATSQLTNDQLKQKQQEVQDAIDNAALIAKAVQLSPEQQKTAELCLANMKSVVDEITTLAQVANAVSYREFLNGHGLEKKRCTIPQGVGKGVRFVQLAAEGCQ
jgi:hypothetical protein